MSIQFKVTEDSLNSPKGIFVGLWIRWDCIHTHTYKIYIRNQILTLKHRYEVILYITQITTHVVKVLSIREKKISRKHIGISLSVEKYPHGPL